MLFFQRAMEKRQKAIQMISELLKSFHQMAQRIIQNIGLS